MLESPLALPCGVTVKNRIAKAAMSENMAKKDKSAGASFPTLYRQWSAGGTGLIVTGNVMISSEALGEPNNVVIEKGHENLESLKAWAEAGTEDGTQLWMQLNHPGKQSPKFLSETPVAPSAVGFRGPMSKMFNVPRALTEAEIWDIVERFAFAAETAKKAGFTGVQIHGAHGYLVSQFLSPLHNQRTDQWGGSLENRMRFVREVFLKVRAAVGSEFPIGVKLNSSDFQRGGFSPEESIEVAKSLGGLGVDLLEISGGTYESPEMMTRKKKSTLEREAYFLEYCEEIKREIEVPLMLTGGFRSRGAMEQALESGACDMIGLARSLAIDPEFSQKLLNGEDVKSRVKPLSTGFKVLDKLMPIEIIWYTEQIHRLGEGKKPLLSRHPLTTVLSSLVSMGLSSLKRVR